MSRPTDRFGIQPPPPVRDVDTDAPGTGGPFVHSISVGWGDCDPAQIAYTARIPAWGLDALEAWYRACLGVGWFEINMDHGIGTPFVSLAFDFASPVTPRAPLDCAVFVTRIGRSSLSHRIEGAQAGTPCFAGTTTAAFVDASRLKAIAIPPNMRRRIGAYADLQGRPLDAVPLAADGD